MEAARSIDIEKLAGFIRELSVARQFIATYPPGHPHLVNAEKKAASSGGELVNSSGAFTIGVSKETLYLLDADLDKSNSTFSAFARILFDNSVATISFIPGILPEELHILNSLLASKPEKNRAEGGFAAAVNARCEHIVVKEINYAAFVAIRGVSDTTEKHNRLWELFIKTVLSGADSTIIESYSGIDMDDVDSLSRIISEIGDIHKVRDLIHSYSHSLLTFSKNLNSDDNLYPLVKRVGELVNRLPEDLREQFLQSSVLPLSSSPEALKEMLEAVDPDFVITALNEMIDQGGKIPPLVMALASRLKKEKKGTLPEAIAEEQETASRLKELFREDDLDDFLPKSYQEALCKILVSDAAVDSDVIPEDFDQEMSTMSEQFLEIRTGEIILQLLKQECDADLQESLVQNLNEMCRYYIDLGEFSRVLASVNELKLESEKNPYLTDVLARLKDFLASPDIVKEIINGLTLWGKSKFEDIRKLIHLSGEQYATPLLEKLADEQNMSLRRFYMEMIIELKPSSETLVERLKDKRWYFIRNILVLLRTLGDKEICRMLHRLIQHPHPKVRSEVIRTLIHFGDREADKFILSQLDSSDEESLVSAIQLAERTKNLSVFNRVLSFMDRGGLTNYEYRLKSAAVLTLAEIGNPAALERLDKILFSASILHSSQHNRLKMDIVKSLSFYPPSAVIPLFKKIAASGSREMITQAEETYRVLQKKQQGKQDDEQTQ